ncbi:uncharacterized protein LOC130670917 [Microplitis mediator]|uniref:uncharacterized protein LOC130670917 n=1 Tax=Microplitis mediator TaxID=375433 RepID=UPI002554EF51|nr:uncharacterized protein LOC130670917 [Microplitis mediator]
MSLDSNLDNKCKEFYREEIYKILQSDILNDANEKSKLSDVTSSESNDSLSDRLLEIINCDEKTSCSNPVCDFLINIIDSLLATILIPFFIWQRISTSEYLIKIIKISAEVILELIVWSILAGVSILATIILIIDDSDDYNNKNQTINRKKNPNNKN